MTIAPSKGKMLQTALLFVCVACGFFLMQSDGEWSWIVTLIYFLLLSLCVRVWIATGRTFSFTAEGISVRFLWRTHSYRWDEITYTGIFYCKDYSEHHCIYEKGLEFAVDHKKRPHWMGVGLYAVLIHPVKYIYIYFGPQTQISKRNGYPPEYEVEETAFLQLLKEWNVNIE